MTVPAIEPSDVARFTRGIALPDMYLLRQRFDALPRVDVTTATRDAMSGVDRLDRLAGKRVGIAVGSRGVSEIPVIVRTAVRWVREHGGDPVVLPAMGSHGGATADGQERTLAELGVTPSSVGAVVRSSLDAEQVGETMGRPVFWSTDALRLDAIVIVNRVKPHTCFRGRVESGLTKMLAVGLGKQRGAAQIHTLGDDHLGDSIPAFAEVILGKAPPTFGVAIVENSYHDVCHVEAMPAARFSEREPELLSIAREQLPQIRLDRADVLAVDRIGKDISGDGMDPNVTGRFANPSLRATGFVASKIAVLGLTPHTQGNAHGIGLADVTTRTVLDEVDWVRTYLNGFTAGVTATVRMPAVLPTPATAVRLAMHTAGVDADAPRVVRIRDTLSVEHIAVSAALVEDAVAHGQATVVDGPRSFFAAMPR